MSCAAAVVRCAAFGVGRRSHPSIPDDKVLIPGGVRGIVRAHPSGLVAGGSVEGRDQAFSARSSARRGGEVAALDPCALGDLLGEDLRDLLGGGDWVAAPKVRDDSVLLQVLVARPA